MNTLESRIKRTLTIGTHRVDLMHDGRTLRTLVEVRPRGAVHIIPKPREDDMYTCWRRLRGDTLGGIVGAVVVWGARNPECVAQFDGEPAATLPLHGS